LSVKAVIQQLGATVTEYGGNLIIESRGLNIQKPEFNVGESGLAVRMLSPVLALSGKDLIINGKGSLLNRPVNVIADALRQTGAEVTTNEGSLPVNIRGRIMPGKFEIDCSLTSQVLTGLLIALPLADDDSEIKVRNLKSKPYIDMTIKIMRDFGVGIKNDDYRTFFVKGNQRYLATEYEIEGDWSGAAFLLVAAAIAGEAEVLNLDYRSKQADKKIVDVLKSAGAEVSVKEKSVFVKKKNLDAFKFDATDCPDLFPPLVCLAVACDGISIIKGVSRLKHKESDRAETLQKEFEKAGVRIEIVDDNMKVYGSGIYGTTIDSRGDHRIAMAAGVMNLVSEGEIVINGENAVGKSYPHFFQDLRNLF
jgi:3-phosphoshikimate 1-carboxyvinyltransferase